MYRQRNPLRAMTGGILLIGLAIAFFAGGGGHLFLPILFVTLAFTSLIGSFSSFRPNGIYGGLYGFVWMLGLAFCFLVGFWPWILVVVGISVILGALRAPIMAAILGMGVAGAASFSNRQQPYYSPPQPAQPYQSYQEGYQPSQPQEVYQEGGQQYQYPPQPQQPSQPEYEHPQAQYPQELPPQQQ